MVTGSPQFVRCIKPNDTNLPQFFDKDKVIQQLRYTGVLETIRIRQSGFSHRIPFSDFLKRYCFLAFGYDETVVANRDNCRLLLIRLKMDGWALGKTKVFLKYYHVEFLSRMFEEQSKKIIMVQACVRRWLAKIHYKQQKWQLAFAIVTLQKYIRGWLSRKRISMKLLSKKLSESSSIDNPVSEKEKIIIDLIRNQKESLKLSRKSFSEDSAAVIIQSYYRGYSIRKHRGYQFNENVKTILNKCVNKEEAREALINSGVPEKDAIFIVHRWFKQQFKIKRKSMKNSEDRIHSKLRQVELIQFSQDVHMKNQEMHKNLRKNKPGVALTDIEEPDSDYVRPEGFKINDEIMNNRNDNQSVADQTINYYRDLKEEMSSGSELEEDEVGWDLPLTQLENDRQPSSSQNQELVLKVQAERLARSSVQSDFFIPPEQHLSDIWHKALNQPNSSGENEKSGNSIRGVMTNFQYKD